MTRKIEHMCAYGNCQNTMVAGEGLKVSVSISHNGTITDRKVFCSHDHGADWLRERGLYKELGITDDMPKDERIRRLEAAIEKGDENLRKLRLKL